MTIGEIRIVSPLFFCYVGDTMAGLDAFNIIKTIMPEIATQIRQNLNDPSYAAQLAQYRD